jgi:hypothetical protein
MELHLQRPAAISACWGLRRSKRVLLLMLLLRPLRRI